MSTPGNSDLGGTNFGGNGDTSLPASDSDVADDGANGDDVLSGDPTSPTDDDPSILSEVHYIGRFEDDADGHPSFEWPGSGFVARFTGTGIAIKLSGSKNWFETVIDDETRGKFEFAGGSAKTISIANELSPGEHKVEVYRRTESFNYTNQFLGFEVTGGALIPSVFPFEHRIEFIGDSITCGYGIEGDGPECPFDNATSTETLAYGAVTARNLNAAHTAIAWSGRGMYRQTGDGSTDEQLPEIYDRALPTETDSTWDFTRYIPEVIVINLGTNDWGAGDPGQPYIDAYIAFVTRLRDLYPDVEIFCTMGPMQNSDAAHQHVKDVVAERMLEGDDKIHYVGFGAQTEAEGLGCDWHPGIATAERMAETITDAIRDVTGW